MAYYADLTPCDYFEDQPMDQPIAVGWLEQGYPYQHGQIAVPVLDKLFDLLIKPWTPAYFMGIEECSFCDLSSYRLTVNDKTIRLGNLNLFVPGEGKLYVMPSLAVHYILAHSYAPPQEFCEAVIVCPPMGSQKYFQAIIENAPHSYAEAARAKLATAQ